MYQFNPKQPSQRSHPSTSVDTLRSHNCNAGQLASSSSSSPVHGPAPHSTTHTGDNPFTASSSTSSTYTNPYPPPDHFSSDFRTSSPQHTATSSHVLTPTAVSAFAHPSFGPSAYLDFDTPDPLVPQINQPPDAFPQPDSDHRQSLSPFSPNQLSALLDEKIRQLGPAPSPEADGGSGVEMNIAGIDFSGLNRTYRITPIQQPKRTAAFENLYLSRVPLSPPLILQFDCWSSQNQQEIPYDELPFLVCHVTLETPSGEDATLYRSPESGEVMSMIYGTLVASPAEMKDMQGAHGVYFCFPDVSVKMRGEYRLRANLMRITGGPPLDTTQTESFEVQDVTDYVAHHMTRHFDAQGVVRLGLPRDEW